MDGKVMVPPAGAQEQPLTTTYERCVQTTGSGERPHIWWDGDTQEWVCWNHHYPYARISWAGVGATPQAAYIKWKGGCP